MVFRSYKLPSELANSLDPFLPANSSDMTLKGWFDHFLKSVDILNEDKNAYKNLRNIVDKGLNNGKFTVDYNSIDFNDDLKNSPLQKSFIEFVNNTINPKGDKQISKYDFFVNAYFSLDLLGISKEKASKVRFRNVMNDGFHSYYGAYCDYVISHDEGFLKKQKLFTSY